MVKIGFTALSDIIEQEGKKNIKLITFKMNNETK